MRRLLLLVALIPFLIGCSAARSGSSGAIHGIVSSSGAVLAGVTVTLSANGFSQTAITDAQGRYNFVNVPPGIYTLRAELPGLATEQVRVAVVADQPVELRTDMGPARVAEAITVSTVVNQAGIDQASAYPAAKVSGVAGGVIAAEIKAEPQYAHFADHEFLGTGKDATTTFAIDVDRASYANVRRFLTAGLVPPPDAVRIEEMLNYFAYSYPQPAGVHPFSITTEVASCPWNADHRLLRIGIQGRNLEEWRMAPNNLVFLIDVSGSMQPPARLPLLKSAFKLLVDKLRAEDRVAIVVYAGAAGVVLPSTSGADKQTILAALDRLNAGGSTAGAEGIQLAYDVAKQNFIAGGNNRVILATDGDFNVGVTDRDALLKMIEDRRDAGICLTTLGVGDDNYQDARMEMLADHGNGNYAYLDNLKEAEKVFVHELTGTLVTIAKDVKVQLEFNRALVKSYRQIGYENRALENKDFDDDTRDAGELGAGHSVTALYEIVPADNGRGTIADLRLRYKQPAGTKSDLITAAAVDDGKNIYEASADLQFAAAVAEFGMLLRHSKDRGTATYADALALARASRGVDLDGTREELLRLLDASRALSGEAGPAMARQ
ncbi:MAG TPA: von Willebrand factor type A domain-containing protein [Thermoanaerobaculia bacterium]|nr:von Willebrand factor type A domain-containing protein [Thermoanaerobaculia bacterium]